MNDQIMTISLLATNAALLLLVFLLMDTRRAIKHNFQHLDEHMEEDAEDVQEAVREDGKLTRERIAQVKTRLADEESDDQRRKRQARRQG